MLPQSLRLYCLANQASVTPKVLGTDTYYRRPLGKAGCSGGHVAQAGMEDSTWKEIVILVQSCEVSSSGYSSLRVFMGSTLVARYAGMRLANKPTLASKTDTAPNVIGSVGFTP
jgi:hypothetical protein